MRIRLKHADYTTSNYIEARFWFSKRRLRLMAVWVPDESKFKPKGDVYSDVRWDNWTWDTEDKYFWELK